MITEANLSAFVYRLFHEDLFRGLDRNLHEAVCKQVQLN